MVAGLRSIMAACSGVCREEDEEYSGNLSHT